MKGHDLKQLAEKARVARQATVRLGAVPNPSLAKLEQASQQLAAWQRSKALADTKVKKYSRRVKLYRRLTGI